MTPAQTTQYEPVDITAINRIEILQWRESGDDDDTVDFRIIPAHAATSIKEVVAEAYEVEFVDQDDPPTFVISEQCICDGEQLTAPDGRKYLVTITEIVEPKAKTLLIHRNEWTLAELTQATIARELEDESIELASAHDSGTRFTAYSVAGPDEYERLAAADDFCRACCRAMKHEDLCQCGHGPECHVCAQSGSAVLKPCGAEGCNCQQYAPIVTEASGA